MMTHTYTNNLIKDGELLVSLNPLDHVREHAEETYEDGYETEMIGINDFALEILVDEMQERVKELQTQREQIPPVAWPERLDDFEKDLALHILFATVNFAFTDLSKGTPYTWVNPTTGTHHSGSTALFEALKNFDGIDWNNPRQVEALDKDTLLRHLQLSETNTLYLASERIDRIKRFAGNFVTSMYGQQRLGFHSLAINYSAETAPDFIRELILIGDASEDMDLFGDDPFLKRAQVCTQQIHRTLLRGFGTIHGFKEMDQLTLMPDYRLAQLLIQKGVIVPNETFVTALEKGRVLEGHSSYVDVVRAATVVAGQKMATALGVTEADLDTLLWTYAKELQARGELVVPQMLVRTTHF